MNLKLLSLVVVISFILLGFYFLERENSIEKKIDDIRVSAELGKVEAEYSLGGLYYKGLGVEKNINKSIYWFKKAAKQGYPNAAYNLGVVYNNPLLDIYDRNEAEKWFLVAANYNHSLAMYNLGFFYSDSRNKKKFSLEKSNRFYEKSLQEGYVRSAIGLGKNYQRDSEIQDLTKSDKYYSIAVNDRNEEALYLLGKLHVENKLFFNREKYGWKLLLVAESSGYEKAIEYIIKHQDNSVLKQLKNSNQW